MAKKIYGFLWILGIAILLVGIVSAETTYNFLTKGRADLLYCQQNGNCNVSYLSVLNKTVSNMNITGDVNAYAYYLNGSPINFSNYNITNNITVENGSANLFGWDSNSWLGLSTTSDGILRLAISGIEGNITNNYENNSNFMYGYNSTSWLGLSTTPEGILKLSLTPLEDLSVYLKNNTNANFTNVNIQNLNIFGSIYSIGNASFPNIYNKTFVYNKSEIADNLSIYLKNNTNANFTNVNITQNLFVGGNLSVKRPYAMLSSNHTHTLIAANTAYPVFFNQTEDIYLINVQNNVNISVEQSGDYLIELSAIFSTSIPNTHPEIWVQKTNSSGQMANIPRSNTRTHLSNANAEQVVSVPFIIDLLPTEKFRIMWAGDNNNIQMIYTGATAYSPETPSIIMTISKISEVT